MDQGYRCKVPNPHQQSSGSTPRHWVLSNCSSCQWKVSPAALQRRLICDFFPGKVMAFSLGGVAFHHRCFTLNSETFKCLPEVWPKKNIICKSQGSYLKPCILDTSPSLATFEQSSHGIHKQKKWQDTPLTKFNTLLKWLRQECKHNSQYAHTETRSPKKSAQISHTPVESVQTSMHTFIVYPISMFWM